MPNGLITPELVLEVAEAGEDLVITPTELESILGMITVISAGVMIMGFVGILLGPIAKGFTKETGIKTVKVGQIPIPI